MADFGADFYCLDDLTMVDQIVTDPRIVVGQRVYRRLTTPRGALAIIGGPAGAGFDVRQLVNAKMGPGAVTLYQNQISRECEEDEAVEQADVTVTPGGDSIAIVISIATAAGPFRLVFEGVTAANAPAILELE